MSESLKAKAEPVERNQPKGVSAREPHTPTRYPLEEHTNVPPHAPVSNEVVYYPHAGGKGAVAGAGEPSLKAKAKGEKKGDVTGDEMLEVKRRTIVALNNHPMNQDLANMLRDYWDEFPLSTSDYQFPADPHAVTIG